MEMELTAAQIKKWQLRIKEAKLNKKFDFIDAILVKAYQQKIKELQEGK